MLHCCSTDEPLSFDESPIPAVRLALCPDPIRSSAGSARRMPFGPMCPKPFPLSPRLPQCRFCCCAGGLRREPQRGSHLLRPHLHLGARQVWAARARRLCQQQHTRAGGGLHLDSRVFVGLLHCGTFIHKSVASSSIPAQMGARMLLSPIVTLCPLMALPPCWCISWVLAVGGGGGGAA